MDYDDGFARSPNGLSLIHEIKIIYFKKKIIKIKLVNKDKIKWGIISFTIRSHDLKLYRME